MGYQIHTVETAPDGAKRILKQVQSAYGFVPNLMGVMAEAPALLEGYITLSKIFEQSSLSLIERQVVLLATSFINNCTYCMAAHTTIASSRGMSNEVMYAIKEGKPITDRKLEALRSFTQAVVETSGWPPDHHLQQFFAAGYSRANALEVVLGIGLKTLSNYTNHLAKTPIDSAFKTTQ